MIGLHDKNMPDVLAAIVRWRVGTWPLEYWSLLYALAESEIVRGLLKRARTDAWTQDDAAELVRMVCELSQLDEDLCNDAALDAVHANTTDESVAYESWQLDAYAAAHGAGPDPGKYIALRYRNAARKRTEWTKQAGAQVRRSYLQRLDHEIAMGKRLSVALLDLWPGRSNDPKRRRVKRWYAEREEKRRAA